LSFRDNELNETGFVVERSVNGGGFATLATLPPRALRGTVQYLDANTIVAGNTYGYRVYAISTAASPTYIPSAYSNSAQAVIPAAPAAPGNFAGTAQATSATQARVNMTWTDLSNNESRFVIQRATNLEFTTGLATFNRAANGTSYSNTGLQRGATYYYRIAAQNLWGQSAWVPLNPTPIVTP
jgi:hypothetical protein